MCVRGLRKHHRMTSCRGKNACSGLTRRAICLLWHGVNHFVQMARVGVRTPKPFTATLASLKLGLLDWLDAVCSRAPSPESGTRWQIHALATAYLIMTSVRESW